MTSQTGKGATSPVGLSLLSGLHHNEENNGLGGSPTPLFPKLANVPTI